MAKTHERRIPYSLGDFIGPAQFDEVDIPARVLQEEMAVHGDLIKVWSKDVEQPVETLYTRLEEVDVWHLVKGMPDWNPKKRFRLAGKPETESPSPQSAIPETVVPSCVSFVSAGAAYYTITMEWGEANTKGLLRAEELNTLRTDDYERALTAQSYGLLFHTKSDAEANIDAMLDRRRIRIRD